MTDTSTILQVNATLSEGGAAGVARTLYEGLDPATFTSDFAYGYGPHGRDSPLEGEYAAVRVGSPQTIALNRLLHPLLGRDTNLASQRGWRNLRETLEHADLVHLHVVHSYYVDTSSLVELIIRAQIPVVWTMHDQWLMTGRCAQPGSCTMWMQGCATCPDLRAYPPAKIDRAATRFTERRALIRRLQSEVPTSIVACAQWLADEATRGGIESVRVIQNSVDKSFWEAARGSRPRLRVPTRRVVFMCRDLRDQKKIDWPLLAELAANPQISLTIIGDDAPHHLPDVVYISSIRDRAELANELAAHDVLLFTSLVDYFPLTVAEALTAGTPVVARDSQASREFAQFKGVHLYSDRAEAIKLLSNLTRNELEPPINADFFAPRRMTDEYSRLYLELLSDHRE